MSDQTCTAQYERPGGRERGDRIVRCHLAAGHPGEHVEADTEVTWTERPKSAPDGRAAILMWDVGQQPDLDRLALVLSDLTNSLIHVRQPETHGDDYALLITTRPVDQERADDIYRDWYHDEQATDVFDLPSEASR